MRHYATPMPSMSALRVLVALADRGSTTAAAETIHLSQSAVSKQLITLETLLGEKVFIRSRAGLVPTAIGRIYIDQARVAIRAMEDAAFAATQLQADPHVLRLKVLPILGDRWLLPRLADFNREYPQIKVQYTTLNSDHPDEQPDGAFLFAEKPAPSAQSWQLFGQDVRLVCTPDYLARLGTVETLADLMRGTLLVHPGTPLHWSDFVTQHGKPGLMPRNVVQFEYYTLVLRATQLGQGLALVPLELVEAELANGQLVNPRGFRYEAKVRYWFSVPFGRTPSAALDKFTRWLRAQVSAT